MFDRGKPKESAPPSSSPDRKTGPPKGSYMNNEQFCSSPPRVPEVCKPVSTNPGPLHLQLHTSEIFATIESIGPVVRGRNLHPSLPRSTARAFFASRPTATLHWV